MFYGNIQKAKVIRGNNYINYDCVVFYIDDGMEITQLTIQVPLGNGYDYAIRMCNNVDDIFINW